MTRPPRSTKTPSVSRACAISAALPATSNTCQVPRPTAGSRSPVFGIGRSRTSPPADSAGIRIAPRMTAPAPRKARRLTRARIAAPDVPSTARRRARPHRARIAAA